MFIYHFAPEKIYLPFKISSKQGVSSKTAILIAVISWLRVINRKHVLRQYKEDKAHMEAVNRREEVVYYIPGQQLLLRVPIHGRAIFSYRSPEESKPSQHNFLQRHQANH